MGGGASPLRIHHADYKCTGDDSRLCCEAPAFGQTVIATGVLTESAHGWGLDNPIVCEVVSEGSLPPLTNRPPD